MPATRLPAITSRAKPPHRGLVPRAALILAVGALLISGLLAPVSLAQNEPDQSDVVLVLDYSASILDDATNRNRFATALDDIADRIDATSADLAAGDTTVTIVQFATRAADYPGCVEMKLFLHPSTVARFANCLRDAATAYRGGLNAALTAKIGVDTNYVAAMTVAARHLPADAVRPALILFTDGKHDVQGVPIAEVQPTRDRLFGSRSPFALLPVGMGLSPAERPALESGLANLRLIRDMPACGSGSQIDWPQVVFESPAEAGNAVAVALQNVTCTFTVAPTPTPPPTPTPTPVPTPGEPRAIGVVPGDQQVEVHWAAPTTAEPPIVGYRTRCRTGDGEWVEAASDTSLETSVVIGGLTNGAAYSCEVMAVGASADGAWTPASAPATPLGRPAPPEKPAVQPLNGGVRFQVPPADRAVVSDYRFECSSDDGQTWLPGVNVASDLTTADIQNLTNGTPYVCRAFASNTAGTSDASALSDVVRPCASLFDCNPIVAPALGILAAVLLAGILLAVVALYRDRTRGYVVAVVDVVHTANLGYGSRLGMRFERTDPDGAVTGVVSDRGRNADLRIRHRGGDTFEVRDRAKRYEATSGEPMVVVDRLGTRHQVVLRRFRGTSLSAADR
jgi:hypothetical protein